MPTGLGDEQIWLSATNDNTGTSTAFDDQSGNGNDGTATGTLVVADTNEGGSYAFDFDGSNDQISVLGGIGTGTTDAFCLSFWWNWAGTGTQYVWDMDYTENNALSVMTKTASSRLQAIARPNSDGSGNTYMGVVTNTWTHIVYQRVAGSNQIKSYRDGVENPVVRTASDPITLSNDLTVGAANGPILTFDGMLDDIRWFNKSLTQAEITHLATSRGIEGGPTFLGVSLRANASYVTDTDNFVVCTPNTATSTNQTDEYNATQGFGMVAGTYSSANFRDRSTSVASQLAGMTFQSLNGATFRLDLPDGAGEYKVWFAGIDAAAGQATGWRFKDGTGGTEFATLDTATTTTQYVDINNTLQLASAFDIAGSNYIQRTFTNDHFTIVRDTSLASGNGVISAVWVEKVGGTPPVTQYNAFITHAFKQLFQTRLR